MTYEIYISDSLHFLSRGAKRAVLCDNSKDAIKIIKQNVQKTHFEEIAESVIKSAGLTLKGDDEE